MYRMVGDGFPSDHPNRWAEFPFLLEWRASFLPGSANLTKDRQGRVASPRPILPSTHHRLQAVAAPVF